MKHLILLIAVLLTPIVSFAATIVIGHYGRTYVIAEKDAIKEIQERAREINWAKIFNSHKWQQRIKSYKPKDLEVLPRAKKSRSYLVSMTYTLPFNIPDGRGGILYPKGYTFNPLDYISFPNILVIIDGSDPKEIKWFKKSIYAHDYRTMVLLTSGSYWQVEEKLKRPVFYLTKIIAKRLKIRAVPSVVYQKGRYMEVRVYALH